MKDIVICLFDESGILGKPWADAGYRVICVDKENSGSFAIPEPGQTHRMQFDLMYGVPPEFDDPAFRARIAFVGAFPPCTHVAVSGSRWFRGKGLRKLADSIHMFATAAEFCDAVGAPYFIENPVSVVSSHWRKPDYTFHPWFYNGICRQDSYTKRTCLWTGGGSSCQTVASTNQSRLTKHSSII